MTSPYDSYLELPYANAYHEQALIVRLAEAILRDERDALIAGVVSEDCEPTEQALWERALWLAEKRRAP